jgi:hypothetical protein
MQSLTSVVGEQSKHGAHGKIDQGLRNADASVYAHLCKLFSVRISKAMPFRVRKILAVFAIF